MMDAKYLSKGEEERDSLTFFLEGNEKVNRFRVN